MTVWSVITCVEFCLTTDDQWNWTIDALKKVSDRHAQKKRMIKFEFLAITDFFYLEIVQVDWVLWEQTINQDYYKNILNIFLVDKNKKSWFVEQPVEGSGAGQTLERTRFDTVEIKAKSRRSGKGFGKTIATSFPCSMKMIRLLLFKLTRRNSQQQSDYFLAIPRVITAWLKKVVNKKLNFHRGCVSNKQK